MNHEHFKYNYLPGEGLRVIRPANGTHNQVVFQYHATVPLNLLDIGMRQIADTKAAASVVTLDTILGQAVQNGWLVPMDPNIPAPGGITQVNLLTNDAQELQVHLDDYATKGRHIEFGMYLDHHLGAMLDQPHLYLNHSLPPGLVIASKEPQQGFLPTSREDYIQSTVVFRISCMLYDRPEVVATLRPLHLYRYSAGVNPTYEPVSVFDAPELTMWLRTLLNGVFSSNNVNLIPGEVEMMVYSAVDRTTQATMRMKIGLEEGMLQYKLQACLEPRHMRTPVFVASPSRRNAPQALSA